MSAHVFVGYFAREDELLEAARDARRAGLTIHDAYTPYAVHGVDEALGLRPSRLPWVCFFGGLTGLAVGWALQYYTSVVSWPLNVGGKPFHSLPAFIPVMFEVTVAFAAFSTVGALFLRERLFPGARAGALPRVTNDRFALALATRGVRFDEREARSLFERHGAIEIEIAEVEK
ncbi:MAG: DUF3341 domain-containing protein [Polyangiaceae bacterium]|nr:DUF3341 domain-containing protein [Polyangiaceae bacterium]